DASTYEFMMDCSVVETNESVAFHEPLELTKEPIWAVLDELNQVLQVCIVLSTRASEWQGYG
ncbi:hypothetical protein PISMIDRAFT_97072, partial [Pisolithus microcarpus 441]